MYNKRLSFIDKKGNNCDFAILVHNKERVKMITKSYNSKGYIVVIEDNPLPNPGGSSKDYRL